MITIGVLVLSFLAATVTLAPTEGTAVAVPPLEPSVIELVKQAPEANVTEVVSPTTQVPEPIQEKPVTQDPTTVTALNFGIATVAKPCLMATLIILGLTMTMRSQF